MYKVKHNNIYKNKQMYSNTNKCIPIQTNVFQYK